MRIEAGLQGLPAPLLGVMAFLLLLLNTLVWVPLLLVFALVKLLLPFPVVRLALDPVLVGIAENWIACNSAWISMTKKPSPPPAANG